MEENRKIECCKKTVIREEETVKKLLQRLNRIEGQVRGIKNMVSSNAYGTDIVIQVTAINEALHI